MTYTEGTVTNTVAEYDYDAAGNRTSHIVDLVVDFSIEADVQAVEGAGVTFTVVKSRASDNTETVTIQTVVGGTATSGTDYTAASQALSFAPAELSKTFTVTTTGETIYENDETFTVQLSNYSAGAVAGANTSATGTITNDDTAPSFTINNVSATEGGNLSFTVTKSGSTALSHNVTYATSNGSAAAGSDYTGISATVLTFTSSQTSKTVTVSTTGDTVYEGNETLNVNLSSATNDATIADSQGVGTITNDDAAPSFTINNVSATEGGNITFTVTKSGSTELSHNVTYATANGSAIAGSDYTAISATALTFTAAQTSKTVTVTTTGDTVYEDNETLYVNLSGATNSATISDGQGVGTITDNDTAPSFTINNVSATEGGNLSFTVTKSGSTALSHNVTYATSNGSAAAGSDYTGISATVLTFTSSQTSKTVTVSTTGDTVYEGNETLNVNLSGATNGATIADSQGVGTISENDTAPSFTINNVSASEGNNISFTVTKSGSTALSHNVTYATANGSAAAGSDYTSKSGTLSFTAGQTSKTVSISTIEEAVYENNETLNVNLSSATNGATIADSQGVGTITNDDAAPSFTINNVSASEGNNLTFTVTKSGSTALSHNVNYATANGSAAAGSDYTSKSGTVSFTSGQTSKTVSISTIEEAVYENNETLKVNLSGATNGATIADSQGVGTINNDDTAPSFTINNTSATEGGNVTFTITKSGSTALSHNVNYATANGTAAAGSDYTSKSGTLTYTSSQTSKTVSVATTDDTTYEGNELFYMNLSGATSGATIADSQGYGTIVENDPEPNYPPTAVNDSGSVIQYNTRRFYVLSNDSDPENDPLTITYASSAAGLAVTITCGGTCIEVTGIQTGIRNSTYTISDGNGNSDSAVLTVNITSGGGPPL